MCTSFHNITLTADPDDAAAGYSYSNAEAQPERDLYFYHPDHLGSTSYVTDADGHATQFLSYQPYGAPLFDEHTVSFDSPYKFNAKELDSETGLYYYGARYYDPQLSLFYGTDRYGQKFPRQSPYSYASSNPVGCFDFYGDSVIAINRDAQLNILNTLSSEEASFVRFNSNGCDLPLNRTA